MRILLAALAMVLALTGAAPAVQYGTGWYPEQRPQATWDADLKLMQAAGFTFVRIAEFSWARLEPSEGAHDFTWLDAAIAAADRHGLKTVLGTPTAGPPAWLTTKYPEVLLTDERGTPARHGGRRQFSVSSRLYRQKAAEIAGLMAKRYGRNPAVLGFQIDNEYGRMTWDAPTRLWFQNWLKAKYTTLDALNAAWFSVVWSQTYDDWRQINIPDAADNPGLYLDWMRFWSTAWRDYQQVQIDAIRPHLPAAKFITHNYTGVYDNFDFFETAQPLDLVGWDWYFEGPRIDPAEGGLQHDLYRGFLGRNPWVLETAAGNINWSTTNYTMPKGEVRAMAWQAVAHGADGYAYWTWRPALSGIEQFHGALTDAGGRPQPVYAEAAQVGRELAALGPALKDSVPIADVALLHDYPSRWALKRQAMHKDFDPWRLFVDFYRATRPAASGIAVRRDASDLARFRLVVAPSLFVLPAAEAQRLIAYVRGGGHLVLGPRSGVKDEAGRLWEPGAPGPLAELIGAHVDQANVPPGPVTLTGGATAKTWAERIAIDAADVTAPLRYADPGGWLDTMPGVVTRPVGKGRVTYIGAWLDPPALAAVIAQAAGDAGVAPLLPNLPDGVEATAREGPGGRTLVLINWATAPRQVALPVPMQDRLGSGRVTSLTLAPFGVAVLTP